MQYEITLPADYDMAIIRNRVKTRGGMTDDCGGLGRERVPGVTQAGLVAVTVCTMGPASRCQRGSRSPAAVISRSARPLVRALPRRPACLA